MSKRKSKFMKKAKKQLIRTALLVSNIALVGGVTLFVMNNSSNQSARQSISNSDASVNSSAAANPLDTVSSADIALQVARATNLPEKTSVANHADSVNAQLTAFVASNEVISKPQILSTKIKTKDDIHDYLVPPGEDLGAVAKKFGVTSESIKWSNSLTSNAVSGKKLTIPPVNGFVYTVKAGDTPDSLAQKYSSNKEHIIAFNDAEISGLKVGAKIVIPGGLISAPAYVAPSYQGGFAFGNSAIYGYNGYDYGWCTWWVAKRRLDIGRPVPSNLGDAYTWASRARLAGLTVSSTPVEGAVIWHNAAYPGHVAFVEEVLPDGSIWVSDMNASGQVSKTDTARAGGWNRVSWRHVNPSQYGAFKFIH